jgi:membrane associated rhomboid family serine protease
MNMVLQLILGVSLEIYNGWLRVLIVYLAGGIGGCLGHAVFIVKTYLRGASGGDYALLTAHIATVIMVIRACSLSFSLFFSLFFFSLSLSLSLSLFFFTLFQFHLK